MKCYNLLKARINYTITGTNVDNDIFIIFSYLIPNLFRSCYVGSPTDFKIPFFCPIFETPNEISYYLPNLIDIELIKSFIYFNFPCSIKYDVMPASPSFGSSAISINNIKNTTYDSITSSFQYINSIYSDKSLLLQLMNFNAFLNVAGNVETKNINSFNILWDFTQLCHLYDISNFYIVGNNNMNNIINQNLGNEIYTVSSKLLEIYGISNVTINMLFLLKNNITTVLKIASSVYEDINVEISYIISRKKYCKKPYMNPNNINYLMKLYNNYYNNQVYTNSKAPNSGNLNNIISVKISIEQYVLDFIEIYTNTYPNRFYIKTVYLENSALVFFCSSSDALSSDAPLSDALSSDALSSDALSSDNIQYWYFYINVSNPSAIELFNNNNDLTQYNILTDYIDYKKYKYIEYIDGGLYPNKGETAGSLGVLCNMPFLTYITLISPYGLGLSLIL